MNNLITKKIYPWLYSIEDPLGAFSFVLIGQTAALLYDTGFGVWSIRDEVKKITSLPVTVVLGHGHVDHANGAFDFEEVWIHPADYEICMKHTSRTMRRGIAGGLKDGEISAPDAFDEAYYIESGSYTNSGIFKKLTGDLFDLGRITAQIVPMEGHTAGSIGIFIPEHKTLLTSDASNSDIWMFLEESLPIPAYVAMLKRVKQLDFNTFFIGHSAEPKPKSDFDGFIRVAENICPEKSTPYPRMPELSGLLYSEGNFKIIYRKDKLQ